MTGYVRQDVTNQIQNGNIVDATILDAEFDGVQLAFNNVGGHKHDGTVGEGAPITVVGPGQDVVVTTSVLRPKTNNVMDLGTTALRFKDGYFAGSVGVNTDFAVGGDVDLLGTVVVGDVGSDLLPETDNLVSLGSATQEWKDLYIDGVANIDSLVADTVDINGGTIDGAVIGATTPAAASVTTLNASGTITGNTTGTHTGPVVGTTGTFSSTLGVTGTSTLGAVNASSLTLTTDLAVTEGGTGASTPANARTNLGLGSVATLNTGTASGEVRTNSQNEAKFEPLVPANLVNKFINGQFKINQRGVTSYSAPAPVSPLVSSPDNLVLGGTEGPDMWKVHGGDGALGNPLFSWTSNTAFVGNKTPTHVLAITNSGWGTTALQQKIEDVRSFAGNTITVFVLASASSTINTSLAAVQYFGSGGSPSANVGVVATANSTVSLNTTPSWKKMTLAIPAVSGKTLGTADDHYLSLHYWLNASSSQNSTTNSIGPNTATVSIYDIILLTGDVDISFVNLVQPLDVSQELARCQRYFGAFENCMRMSTAIPFIGQMTLPVTMRATPTLSNITQSGSGATFSATKTSVVQSGPNSNSVLVNTLWASAEL